MPVHKLVLLPRDPLAAPPDPDALQRTLRDCGLVGPARSCAGHDFFPTGEHFLQLVSFLGCSPAIELDPPDDPAQLAADLDTAAFCHVTLPAYAQCVLRADPATRPPRCPACRQVVDDWETIIADWQGDACMSQWRCSACGSIQDVTQLEFRRTAGFGRVFVDINGIFPAEAVPVDALLARLAALTGSPWQHIYIKE